MVYAIDVSLLVTGIVVLAIGIIMYAIARYITDGPIRKILEIGGIIISVIGMVLIILSIVLPLAGSGLLVLGGG